MIHANVFDVCESHGNGPMSRCIYDSPSLEVHHLMFQSGQHLLIYREDSRGKLSLVVMEGQGELVSDEYRSRPVRTGDVVISEMSEPQALRAMTDMRLLVTIAPPQGVN